MLPISSPLAELYRGQDVPLANYHGALAPEKFSDPETEHTAVRRSAGVFDFSFRAKFTARGADRVRFLHGMVSNDVKGLRPGQGMYAALLDVRGHILADLRVFADEDQLIVDTDADLIEKALRALDHYNIGGRVPLERAPLFALSFEGPQSRGTLEAILGAPLGPLGELSFITTDYLGRRAQVVKANNTGEEGYEVWAEEEAIRSLWRAAQEREPKGAPLLCGTMALETLRIEAGIPRYGSELGEDTLPLEAGIMNALSFTKGCYVGQEIVERARSRGHVNWKLVGLVADSASPPAPGTKLISNGKEIGEVTSACLSPTLGKNLALAYVRREASDPGTTLTLASGDTAQVTPLPFYQARAAPRA